MSTQPLEMVIAETRSVLENVSGDQLSAQSPCASWDVAEVINHIIGGQAFFQAGLAGTPPAENQDWAAGDYVAAFDEAAATTVSMFQEDGAMERMITLPFGDMPGSALMGLAMADTFQHAWDVAKATGQSTDLNPQLATQLLEASKQNIQDSFRGPEGAPFGPEVTAPEGSSAADQLAAFLGRQV